MATFSTISPIDGKPLLTRPLASKEILDQTLSKAKKASAIWKNTPIQERVRICSEMVKKFNEKGSEYAKEITLQMGR